MRIKASGATAPPPGGRETIFHHLLNSELVKEGSRLSDARMVAEGVIMVGAATDVCISGLISDTIGRLTCEFRPLVVH